MELLLLALGACTATDVVIIWKRSGRSSNPWKSFARANVRRSRPRSGRSWKCSIVFRGNLDDAAVKHAIQLSEDKYCSVAAMLRKRPRFRGAMKFFRQLRSGQTGASASLCGCGTKQDNTCTTLYLRQ